MKKIATYRRGKPGEHSGLKERVVWFLTKGPMTGRQLADALRVPLDSIRDNLRPSNLTRGIKTVEIKFSPFEMQKDGTKDRLYWIERSARRVTPKVGPKKQIIISKNSLHTLGAESKRIHEEAAARRRRLHDAGLWISLSDIE